jgi:hypothetical protein
VTLDPIDGTLSMEVFLKNVKEAHSSKGKTNHPKIKKMSLERQTREGKSKMWAHKGKIFFK